MQSLTSFRTASLLLASLARVVPAIVNRFVEAEVRQFEYDDLEAAMDWVD